jgi:hypothetical protein
MEVKVQSKGQLACSGEMAKPFEAGHDIFHQFRASNRVFARPAIRRCMPKLGWPLPAAIHIMR